MAMDVSAGTHSGPQAWWLSVATPRRAQTRVSGAWDGDRCPWPGAGLVSLWVSLLDLTRLPTCINVSDLQVASTVLTDVEIVRKGHCDTRLEAAHT